MTFSTVTSSIARGFYSVGSTATGVTDIDGTHITLSMTVLNRNNIDVFPTATITLPSGDTITCVETDPRHQTALVATTNSIDLPCDGPMPASGKGATVAFVDDGS